jgi:tryptophanyl-tRNA synthetase
MAGEAIAAHLAPLREKRRALASTPGAVAEIIADGDARARAAAEETMSLVREKMHIG